MESLVAVAFGRYVGLQNGEANQLTDAASILFQSQQESHSKSPEVMLLFLCELFHYLEFILSSPVLLCLFSQFSIVGTSPAMALTQRSTY